MTRRFGLITAAASIVALIIWGCGVAEDAGRLVATTSVATPADARVAYDLRPISPTSGATDLDPAGVELSWKAHIKGTNVEATALRFEVYLSEASPPNVALRDEKGSIVFSSTKISTGKLAPSTTYHWQIVAKDLHGNVVKSEIFTFRTRGAPPPKVTPLFPRDGATDVAPRNLEVRWELDDGESAEQFTMVLSDSDSFIEPLVFNVKTPVVRLSVALKKSTRYYWKVIANLRDGRTVESEVFSFVTFSPTPPVFVRAQPVDGSKVPSTKNVSFLWSFTDPDGDELAYNFTLYDSTPTEASTPLVSVNLGEGRYVHKVPLKYGSSYFWQVTAFDLDGNVVRSPVLSFSTPDFPTPVNVKPTDGASDVPISNLELAWDFDTVDEAGQPRFTVLLGEDTTKLELVAETSATSLILPGPLAFESSYAWRVMVRAGERVVEGPVWTFKTESPPRLLETQPGDGEILGDDRRLSWRLERDLPPTFRKSLALASSTDAPPFFTQDLPPGSTETVIPKNVLAKGVTYYWMLSVTSPDGKQYVYHRRSFKTPEPPPLTSPVIVEPRNGVEVNPGKVTVRWRHEKAPGLGVVRYDFLLGTDRVNLSPVATELESATFDLEGLERGRTYFAKVVARDEDGRVSESEIVGFVVRALRAPTAVVPAVFEKNVPVNDFVLSWVGDEVPGVTYDVYLGIDPRTMQRLAVGTSSTSLKVSAKLNYDTEYFWRVDARSGGLVTVGEIASFRTIPLPKPQVLRPSNFSSDVPSKGVELRWLYPPIQGENITFDVLFGDEPTRLRALATGLSATSLALGNLEKGRTYFWKVVARNQYGKTSETDLNVFTTSPPTFPSRPVAVDPEDGSTGVDFENASLSWESIDADGDRLRFEVYFDTVTPPLKIATRTEFSQVTVGTLKPGERYFWRVIVTDEEGNTVFSDVFSFTTTKAVVFEDFGGTRPSLMNFRAVGRYEVVKGALVGNRRGDFLKLTTDHGTATIVEFTAETTAGAVLEIEYLVSSEEDHDFFIVLVNEREVLKDSGEKPWRRFKHELLPGVNRIALVYRKDPVRSRGLHDAVFVDTILVKQRD